MDLRQHLEEELSKDFQLLKQLEDKQRYEDDPRQRSKWDAAIKEVKQRIHTREKELKELEHEQRYRTYLTSLSMLH